MLNATVKLNEERTRVLFGLDKTIVGRLRVVLALAGADIRDKAIAAAHGQRVKDSIKLKLKENEYGIKATVRATGVVSKLFEFGFGGKLHKVKSYTRRVKSKDVRAKVMSASGKMRSQVVQKGSVQVKGYDRTLPVTHRPYLLPALETFRNQVRQDIQQAIDGVGDYAQ